MTLKHINFFYVLIVLSIIAFCFSEDICSENSGIIGELNPQNCPEGQYYEKSKETSCIAKCIPRRGKL